MKVDAIKNGIVLDHIEAGKGMEIYNFLKLDELDCPVALIKNAGSKKMGKKDIIKIDADMNLDLDILGYIAPNVTVNVIKDGEKVEVSVGEGQKITNTSEAQIVITLYSVYDMPEPNVEAN